MAEKQTDAPLCRLCGTSHWHSEPHKFKGTEGRKPFAGDPRPSDGGEEAGCSADAKSEPRQGGVADSTSAVSTTSKATFDRNAYQRDYMRDLPKAKAAGLTVKAWREAQK